MSDQILPDFDEWAFNVIEQNKFTPEKLHESIAWALKASYLQGRDQDWWQEVDSDQAYIDENSGE